MIFYDFILVFAGAVLSAIATIVLIKIFKPKIRLSSPKFGVNKNSKYLEIPVENWSRKYAANKLQIEVAVILNDKSYHFDLDRNDFIILSKNIKTNDETPYLRVFHAYDVSTNTKGMFPEYETFENLIDLLKENNAYLRVRVHANHEFTGFGKAFEARFKLHEESFTRI